MRIRVGNVEYHLLADPGQGDAHAFLLPLPLAALAGGSFQGGNPGRISPVHWHDHFRAKVRVGLHGFFGGSYGCSGHRTLYRPDSRISYIERAWPY